VKASDGSPLGFSFGLASSNVHHPLLKSELTTRNSLIMRVEFHPGGEKLHFDEEFV